MITTAALALAALVPAALAADNAFDAEYYANPWEGVCASGMMQTPIDIPLDSGALPGVPENLVTDIKMPMIKDPVTKNVGSAVQITWDPVTAFDIEDDSMFPIVAAGGDKISDVLLTDATAEYMLKMIPLQIHWHETSEHSLGGMLAPMEAHIVTAVGPGEAPKEWGCDAVWEGGDPVLEKCIAVFGIMYVYQADAVDPPYLANLLSAYPPFAGEEDKYPEATFDLNSILPEDKSYYSYIGSLTTPPCAEGLRWHVFSEPVPVSLEIVQLMESSQANTTDIETGERQLYRHNNRPVQPLNGRTIYHMDASPMRERRARGGR